MEPNSKLVFAFLASNTGLKCLFAVGALLATLSILLPGSMILFNKTLMLNNAPFSLGFSWSFLEPYYKQRQTIFCLLNTSPGNLPRRMPTMFKYWIHKCDDYIIFTSMPKNKSLIDNYEFRHKLYSPKGKGVGEAHANLTMKMYVGFVHVLKNYPPYDWYFKADDDTFVIMENLRLFLADKDPDTNLTYGYNFKAIIGFHSGGAGFVMGRKAFTRLTSRLATNYSLCPNGGNDDLDIQACLRRVNVYMGNSTDELGRERFHVENFMGHFQGPHPSSLAEWSVNVPQLGDNCCSDSTISFHRMNEELILKLMSHPNATRFFRLVPSLNTI